MLWWRRSRPGRRSAPRPCSAATPASGGDAEPRRAGPARRLSASFFVRQAEPVQHVSDGRQRLHDNAAGVQGVAHLLERDPGLARPMARRSSAWGSSRAAVAADRAGAGLPVARTRCISLIAAEALTSKRRPACRIELPPSTACTIRRRRSWDKGAVMINSITLLAPDTRESDLLEIPCRPRTALALASAVLRIFLLVEVHHGPLCG